MKREYRILEYEKIKNFLANEAASPLTRELIEKLEPFSSKSTVEDKLTETSEAVSVIMLKGTLPLGSFDDISGVVSRSQKGGGLIPRQLLDIARHLSLARKSAEYLKSDLPELPIIDEIRKTLVPHVKLEKRITDSIINENEIADNASSELKRIRRSIVLKNEEVRKKLNQFITSSKNKDALQDNVVTMREGRYVIPVKQEHKQKFPGIVHDQSGTGATLFIEPQAVVDLNNELRKLGLDEEKEIERILAELSADVAEVGHDIINNQDLLIKLDFIFAKGRLSVTQKAQKPAINEENHLKIVMGRHPLIDDKEVVPISLSLGSEFSTLIITGPNTGGKTVTLKTTGLFVLMATSGLHIPAEAGTSIPLPDDVYADIGDEQSIEQSLSTFSSHMKNIVHIVNDSTGYSLVLLDELGAGTDPAEGAALAMAVLDRLREKGALVLATTHYTELKKYALDREGVMNASMEFNVDTLSPTYKLTLGTPGRSNAFEISTKLGLKKEIVDKATRYLDNSHLEFEDVLANIEKDRQKAEEERDEALLLKLDLKKKQEELDKKLNVIEEKKEKILSKAKENAGEIIEDAKDVLHKMQSELKNSGEISGKNVEEYRKQLKDMQSSYKEGMKVVENPNPPTPDEIAPGQQVRVLSLNQEGEVVSMGDGDALVQIGRLKVTVPLKELMSVETGSDKKEQKKRGNYGNIYRNKISNVKPQIDIRGNDLDTAAILVEKYLDDVFVANLHEVVIIHGRGEGILREGIKKLLKKNKHVSGFRTGGPGEGGDGATVVTLKQ